MTKSKKNIEKFFPFNLFVFRVSGDLGLRKIYPAMFQRFIAGQLCEEFNIVAVTRKDKTDVVFYEELTKFIRASFKEQKIEDEQIAVFIKRVKLIVIKENNAKDYKELVAFVKAFEHYQNIYLISLSNSFLIISIFQ